MENKILEKITQDFYDTVFEHGVNWKIQWVGNGALPLNMVSKKSYTGINWLILSGKQLTSPIWGTLKQFKNAKIRIRYEEMSKYTEIVFYKMIESSTQTDKDGKPKKFPLLKTYRVWNMSQTEDYVVPVEDDKPVIDFSHEDAETWVRNSGADIRHKENRAYYTSKADYINMPPKENFIDTEDANAMQGYWGTLFHELTHWTGNKKRCDRKLNNGFGSSEYAFEELVAELGACFQSVKFGIEQQEVNADHKKYIASWLKALKDDKKFIFKASAKANKSIQYLEGLQSITE